MCKFSAKAGHLHYYNFLTQASNSRANVRPTVTPLDDEFWCGFWGRGTENIVGISDDDDFANEPHNDYEAVNNIQDVFKQTHGFFERKHSVLWKGTSKGYNILNWCCCQKT